MNSKKILVFNVGSSSIRYSIFRNFKEIKSEKYGKLKSKSDYKRAFIDIYKNLNMEIDFILHRIVHAGEIQKPVKINKRIKKQIKKYSELAPLHNPPQLTIINLAERLKKPQYAIFDNAFFAKLPEKVKTYPIDSKISKKYNIKKYGFHGLSHKAVSEKFKGKTISVHIGNGVSISAIKNKKPIDTTMGFTPLEGLMMCTRSGSIDPGIITFLNRKNINIEKMLLNNSGLKGISGYSDFRDVLKNIRKKDCKLAYEMFVYRIIKQIGSYISALNGVDNIVFTGAIGKNNPKIRKDICKNFTFINIDLDKTSNKKNKEKISNRKSKIKVYTLSPSEELQIVKEFLK